MSGIFGILRLDGRPVELETLQRMSSAMSHRGPDGLGVWHEGPVALGHLAFHTTPESLGERQPLKARECDLVLTADARIDNREELFGKLGFDRRPAQEVSDAALILAAYQRWGGQCPEYLLGDFAFAIWDARRNSLFCVKDRFGVNPLYFYHGKGQLFAFASEIKALLTLEEVSDEIDEMEIAHHLSFPVEQDLGRTYYKEIRRGLPMHTLEVSRDHTRELRYWQLDTTRELSLDSDEEYAEALREIFSQAIDCRLRSTGNVASMLSGGLDSSSMVCVASHLLKERNREPLRTLSAVYPRVPASDERTFINEVLDNCRVEPTFFEADSVSPLAEMDQMKWFGDSANLGHHIYLLWSLQRRAASQGTRVVLHGFDGDTTISHGYYYLAELAAARRWFKLALTVMPYAYRIGGVSPLAAYWAWVRRYGLGPMLQSGFLKHVTGVVRKNRVGRSEEKPVPKWELVIDRAFLARVSDKIVPIQQRPRTERESHASRFMDKLLLDALTGVTSLAAGAGVELRLPFFDVRLVEFCVSLPPEQKLRHGYPRFIMRNAMEGILPHKIQWRATKSDVSHGWRHAMLSYGRADIDRILETLDPRVGQWVDGNRLRALSSRFMEGGLSVAEEFAFWRALTLALWLAPSGVEHNSGHSEVVEGSNLQHWD